MATCERRDDVAVLLLGGCSPDEALEIEHHIRGCDSCARHRRELGIVRSLLDVVDEVPQIEAPPADLRDVVVARMVPDRRRRRDVAMVLLGAAAALLLVVVSAAVWRVAARTADGHDLELVGSAAAPDAWAVVTLHERIDGTIVDVEAGDLPAGSAEYEVRVLGPEDAVLALQPFSVSEDGWAQVLLATTRPVRRGDLIEVVRVDGASEVSVLRCEDCLA